MRLNSSASFTFHSLHVCINVFKVKANWLSTSSRCVSVSERNATATAMGIVCCRLGCNSCVMPFVGVESRNDDDVDEHDDDGGGGDGSDDDEDDDNGFCGGGIDLHDVDEHDDDDGGGGGGSDDDEDDDNGFCGGGIDLHGGGDGSDDDDDDDDGFCGGGKDDDGDEDGGGSCGKDDDDDEEEDDDDALRFDDDDDEDDVVPPYLIVLLMVDGRTMIFLSEGSKSSVQSFRHLSICCLFLSVTLLSFPAFFKMEWIKALFSSVFTASIF